MLKLEMHQKNGERSDYLRLSWMNESEWAKLPKTLGKNLGLEDVEAAIFGCQAQANWTHQN